MRVMSLQETSPSVVYIKDIEIDNSLKGSPNAVLQSEDENTKVEGTGSGFIWDKFGHIVSKYCFSSMPSEYLTLSLDNPVHLLNRFFTQSFSTVFGSKFKGEK